MVRNDPIILSALASEAFDSTTPQRRRDELVRQLLDPLAADAYRRARGDTAIADELIQHVLVQGIRGLYDPARGTFSAWSRTVMQRNRVSILRSRLRTVGGESSLFDRVDDRNGLTAVDLQMDFAAPFCAADLVRVAAWPVRKRVVLLAWFLLWRKLPCRIWGETLAGAGVDRVFPAPAFELLSNSERTAHLASALGVRENTVVQALVRGRHDLLMLRFIEEMIAP